MPHQVQTDYVTRFTQALRLIAGVEPPADLVRKWVDCDESHVDTDADTLQDWAASHAPLVWMTGIGLIDGAEAIASVPCEGEGHLLG